MTIIFVVLLRRDDRVTTPKLANYILLVSDVERDLTFDCFLLLKFVKFSVLLLLLVSRLQISLRFLVNGRLFHPNNNQHDIEEKKHDS
jgi:hypothetical protein